MRIAMVSEHASPLAVLGGHDAGGQNVHVASLATALGAMGHHVTVYTRRDDPAQAPRQRLARNVSVAQVPAGPAEPVPKDDLLPYVPQMARWLRTEWRRTRPDVVHAHFWMSGLATATALQDAHPRPATVQTFHALGVVKRRHQGAADTSPAARPAVERELLDRLDAVVATCRDEVAELLPLGAEPARLHVVPCGVDTQLFHPHGPQHPAWEPGRTRLLALGRLVERKGVETAVRALVAIPDAELVVAGGPAPQDVATDPDVRRIRHVAALAGVADRVTCLGRVPQDEAAALLRSADLLVTTPWYEPFGITPLEAMASGTPVVGSTVGGLLDTVEPGATGLLVAPHDPQAVARAVMSLITRPDVMRQMAAEGRRRAEQGYTWPAVAQQTLAVYEHLVRGDRADRDERPDELAAKRAAARAEEAAEPVHDLAAVTAAELTREG